MAVLFQHEPHPRIEARKSTGRPKTTDAPPTINGRIALRAHRGRGHDVVRLRVRRCWRSSPCPCALRVRRHALRSSQWVSQTFIQLVMLSVIMVGQNILGKAADRRSEMTYNDADATFHEAEQIQAPPRGAGRRRSTRCWTRSRSSRRGPRVR